MLECKDGSQIICQCYDGLADEEIRQLEKAFADISQVEVDEIDAATRSSVDAILCCTTSKNGTSVKSMPNELQNEPPPLIKRKINDSSVKLLSDNFQPIIKKQLFQENFKEHFIRKRTKRKKKNINQSTQCETTLIIKDGDWENTQKKETSLRGQ